MRVLALSVASVAAMGCSSSPQRSDASDGPNDATIFPLDESGVAFAAIQALYAKVDRLAAEDARLRLQVAALRARARAR